MACIAQDCWLVAFTGTWHKGLKTKLIRSACGRQEIFHSFLNPRYICARRRRKTFRQRGNSNRRACELLGTVKKRACKNAIVFRLHGWFAHARAFLLNKKMAGPNTQFRYRYRYRYRNCSKFIILNFSRKCIWSALYVDKIVFYGCETSEISSIWNYT